jgi:hypothetical protein
MVKFSLGSGAAAVANGIAADIIAGVGGWIEIGLLSMIQLAEP